MKNTYISLNKLALNNFNVNTADIVRQNIDSDYQNYITLDEIFSCQYYNVNANYFISTNTKTGEKTEVNTIQLAKMCENLELIEMMDSMGKIKLSTQQKSIFSLEFAI